jgi:hypothetical protein
MAAEIVYRQSISVAQKTKGTGPYGLGFNYVVEAAFALSQDFRGEDARSALEGALARIDHQALGVDLDLGFEPTSAQLCHYLRGEIEKNYAPGVLRLELRRGDGLVAAGALERIDNF